MTKSKATTNDVVAMCKHETTTVMEKSTHTHTLPANEEREREK